MIWQLLGTALVGLQAWWFVRGELHRCPTCRETEIADVARHHTIYHPGMFTPRDEMDPGIGVDPRPHENLQNVIGRQMRQRMTLRGDRLAR